MKNYEDFKNREVYSTSEQEVSLLYAAAIDIINLDTYEFIKNMSV